MSTHTYGVLPEQAQEDALHAARLLQVEERPFQRVTRSLLGKDSLLRWTPPQQLPSPPPDDGDDAGADAEGADVATSALRRQRFREDILLDFAALESSVLRIQLIQSSNARERERYAAEKAKILETAQAVRNSTLELRAQLAEAQRVLELRKGYDELAAKLIDPKKLKPRAETAEDIVKLEKEIEELQQESTDYESTWVGRREAFERAVSEAQAMLRIVKGIKDEPEHETEKDEHMEDGEDGEPGAKGRRSRIGTPAPETGGRTPMAEGGTPLPSHGNETPRARIDVLDVDDGIRTGSQTGSPFAQPAEDVEMIEEDQAVEPILARPDEAGQPSDPQPKTTAGMEATEDQVIAPAEGMRGDEDQVPTLESGGLIEEEASTPAEEMDET